MIINGKARLALILLAVAALATGCFGLFNNKTYVPLEPPLVLEGTLSGPAGLAGENQSTAFWSNIFLQRVFAAQISGESPLKNTPLSIYDLQEYIADPAAAVALHETTTDADGAYSVADIPKGKDLIVIADTVPRYSAIVPATQNNVTIDVNGATTLVGEALAEAIKNDGASVSAQQLNEAVQLAQHELNARGLDEEDLLTTMQQLIPDTIGDGLPAVMDPDVRGLVDAIEGAVLQPVGDTYRVAGWVVNNFEAGVADVEVAFSGGFSSVYTDVTGYWSKDGLSGEVVIEAVSNVLFQVDPDASPVTVDEEDLFLYFWGEPGIYPQPVDTPYDVTGEIVLDDGTPLAGVEVIVHGHADDAVTDADGKFSFANISVATVLEPVSDDYIFQPTQYVITEATDVSFIAQDISEAVIHFPDPTIDFAVRNQLNQLYYPDIDFFEPDTPILRDQVKAISLLRSNGLEITTLEGLQYLTNLRTLDLYADEPGTNNFSDLSPLADLEYLEEVSFDYSLVSDISPLAHKPHLWNLAILHGQVEDLTPVQTMPALSDLIMFGNPIRDLSPLAGLDYIETLYVYDTLITNVDVVPSLTGLTDLLIDNTPELTDISGLVGTSAEWISLNNTPGLDWCDYDATWAIVKDLQDAGKTVRLDNECEGPYVVTVHLEQAGSYTPPVELQIQDAQGVRTAEISIAAPSQLEVEDEAVISPVRVLDEWDHVWRFTPESITVDGPGEAISFSMYETDDHIVEGFITDEFGDPLDVDEVVIKYGSSNQTVTVSTDDNGYFVHEFGALTTVEVYPVKAGWSFTPAVSDRLSTPRRFHFTGEQQTEWMAYVRGDSIYSMSGDGTNVQRIASSLINPMFDWSPDGTRLVFASGHLLDRNVYVVNADGTGLTLLTGDEGDIDADFPAWSSWGDIVYGRRHTDGFEPARNPIRLYITTSAGGPGDPVSQSGDDVSEHRRHPDWSPDGDLIVYAAVPTSAGGGAPSGIYTIRRDGSERSDRLDDGIYPVFAPDGSNRIAYEKDGDVYVMELDYQFSYLLVENAGRPAWSPDGRRIAFVRDGFIYTIDDEGVGSPVFVTEGTQLVWAPE